MCLMVLSCLHVVNDFLWLPEPDEICNICPLLTGQYRVDFCKIPWKRQNSMEKGKFCNLAQNFALRWKLWTLQLVTGIAESDMVTYCHIWSALGVVNRVSGQNAELILTRGRVFVCTMPPEILDCLQMVAMFGSHKSREWKMWHQNPCVGNARV